VQSIKNIVNVHFSKYALVNLQTRNTLKAKT